MIPVQVKGAAPTVAAGVFILTGVPTPLEHASVAQASDQAGDVDSGMHLPPTLGDFLVFRLQSLVQG